MHRCLAQLTPHVLHAWRWWITELYEMLPANLKVFVDANSQRLIISAQGDGFLLVHKSASKTQDVGRIGSSVDDTIELDIPDFRQSILILPRDKVLSRELTLPLATEDNLSEVLSFEMDKETPFTADQVYYEYVVTRRSSSSKTLVLELFVTPRYIVDESLAALANENLHPDIVAPHSADNANGHKVNLMPLRQGRNTGFTQARLNQLLATLALLLLIVTLALPIMQKAHAINSLEEAISQAMTAASENNQLRLDVEKLVKGSKYLVERKRTEKTMMHLLNEISRVIPDDTWVNRIDIAHGELQLQGQSGSTPGLIDLIEESPAFHKAQFRSPITQVARTNQERFHLSTNFLQRTQK
jgi:general secretion pathway protein L